MQHQQPAPYGAPPPNVDCHRRSGHSLYGNMHGVIRFLIALTLSDPPSFPTIRRGGQIFDHRALSLHYGFEACHSLVHDDVRTRTAPRDRLRSIDNVGPRALHPSLRLRISTRSRHLPNCFFLPLPFIVPISIWSSISPRPIPEF